MGESSYSEKANTEIPIEKHFAKDGYYIWQKVIRVLHNKYNINNITNIEIGYWPETQNLFIVF